MGQRPFALPHLPVVWAILGAALFVAVLSLFTSRRAAK
jgi:hypothetical protein